MVLNCKEIIINKSKKYIIPNFDITQLFTNHKCKKKKLKTTKATQGQIRA